MENPILDRRHVKEYFLFGGIAAVLYMIPELLFLKNARFENMYYLFIGVVLFMFTIFYYAYRLLYRPYDRKRAVTMLIAGNLATLAGVAISVLLTVIAVYGFFPDIVAKIPTDQLIQGSPAALEPQRPTGLLFMILMVTVAGNFAVGTLMSVVTAYAGKKDQTQDKPADLTTKLDRLKAAKG